MRIFILSFLAVIVLSMGCKSDHHDHARGEEHAAMCSASLTKAEYADEKIYEQPGVQMGQLTRCPISGAVFRVSETSPHAEQKGEDYYVCCGGCVDVLKQSFARRQ